MVGLGQFVGQQRDVGHVGRFDVDPLEQEAAALEVLLLVVLVVPRPFGLAVAAFDAVIDAVQRRLDQGLGAENARHAGKGAGAKTLVEIGRGVEAGIEIGAAATELAGAARQDPERRAAEQDRKHHQHQNADLNQSCDHHRQFMPRHDVPPRLPPPTNIGVRSGSTNGLRQRGKGRGRNPPNSWLTAPNGPLRDQSRTAYSASDRQPGGHHAALPGSISCHRSEWSGRSRHRSRRRSGFAAGAGAHHRDDRRRLGESTAGHRDHFRRCGDAIPPCRRCTARQRHGNGQGGGRAQSQRAHRQADRDRQCALRAAIRPRQQRQHHARSAHHRLHRLEPHYRHLAREDRTRR